MHFLLIRILSYRLKEEALPPQPRGRESLPDRGMAGRELPQHRPWQLGRPVAAAGPTGQP